MGSEGFTPNFLNATTHGNDSSRRDLDSRVRIPKVALSLPNTQLGILSNAKFKAMFYYIKFVPTEVEGEIEVQAYAESGSRIDYDTIEFNAKNGCMLTITGGKYFVAGYHVSQAIERGSYVKVGGQKNSLSPNLPVMRMNGQPFKNLNNPATGSFQQSNMETVEFEPLPSRLIDMHFPDEVWIPMQTGTGIDELISDEGGIFPGTNVMVGGAPGIGKTSNLIEMGLGIQKTNPGKTVLFISAEMKPINMKRLCRYYPEMESKLDLFFPGKYTATGQSAIQALQQTLAKGYDLIIVDSVRALLPTIAFELGLSIPKAMSWYLNLLNQHNEGNNERKVYSSSISIQQLTRGGDAVGGPFLEYMTDAFMVLQWDKEQEGKRYAMFIKNRYGNVRQKLYYKFAGGTDGIAYDVKTYNATIQTQKLLEANDASTEMSDDEFLLALTDASAAAQEDDDDDE